MIQIKVKINGIEKLLSFPKTEITNKVTPVTVSFAEEFGKYLGTTSGDMEKLTSTQLRKFFGEVKRQQMNKYDETDFALLKPKLAYAKARAHVNKKKYQKIDDFYTVIIAAMDVVLKSSNSEQSFKNFIKIFEAIVAYHKAAEEQK
jgi:CRISPR type III-A-associated protein Csm2